MFVGRHFIAAQVKLVFLFHQISLYFYFKIEKWFKMPLLQLWNPESKSGRVGNPRQIWCGRKIRCGRQIRNLVKTWTCIMEPMNNDSHWWSWLDTIAYYVAKCHSIPDLTVTSNNCTLLLFFIYLIKTTRSDRIRWKKIIVNKYKKKFTIKYVAL